MVRLPNPLKRSAEAENKEHGVPVWTQPFKIKPRWTIGGPCRQTRPPTRPALNTTEASSIPWSLEVSHGLCFFSQDLPDGCA